MTTYQKSNPKTIQAMFGSIAKRYDLTNSVLSFQLHRLWNARLVEEVGRNNPQVLLDICAGTGDIAYQFLEKAKMPAEAILLDFCPEMLECAKDKMQKHSKHKIDFIQGDAQALPFADSSVDAITIAYGIRNVNNPALCVGETFRVLREGGTLGILELTRPQNPLLRMGHTLYLKTALPVLGKIITDNKDAYQYLCNSIHHFVAPATMVEIMQQAGYGDVRAIPLLGGVATVFLGKK